MQNPCNKDSFKIRSTQALQWMCYHQYFQERHYAAWRSLHASLTPWVLCLTLSFQAALPAQIPASDPLFGCQKPLPGIRHICPLGWPPHKAICPALLLLWLKQEKLGCHFRWNSAAAELSSTEEKKSMRSTNIWAAEALLCWVSLPPHVPICLHAVSTEQGAALPLDHCYWQVFSGIHFPKWIVYWDLNSWREFIVANKVVPD